MSFAYFSAEYGITECLPFYSGGLGALAGDHLKSASDLGLPLVGVGLLYQEGYFNQYLDSDGWQQDRFYRELLHVCGKIYRSGFGLVAEYTAPLDCPDEGEYAFQI